MPISRQGSAYLGTNGGTSNNLTVAYTVGSNDRRRLFVAGHSSGSSAPTVQYNGVSMTNAFWDGSYSSDGVWFIDNPSAGSHNVSVTAPLTAFIYMFAADYYGCDQSGVLDASESSLQSSPGADTYSDTLTSSADNCWMFGHAAQVCTGAVSVGGDFTLLQSTTSVGQPMLIADTNGAVHPAGTKTFSTTFTSSSSQAAHFIVSFDPYVPPPLKLKKSKWSPRKRFQRKKLLLPLPIIQPAHVIMKSPISRRRIIWPRRKVKHLSSIVRNQTYPLIPVPKPPRFNQGIAFRSTKPFVTDVQNFDFGQAAGTPNYPVITRQNNIVGWLTTYSTIAGQDQNASQDARLAGNVYNNF